MSTLNQASLCEIERVPFGSSALLRSLLDNYLVELGVVETYPYFALYWQEPTRFPFFILLHGEIVGFALVRRITEQSLFELAEFSVSVPFRRRRVGACAACALFMQFAGRWQLSVSHTNAQALAFWRKVLPQPILEATSNSGNNHVFTFVASEAARAA